MCGNRPKPKYGEFRTSKTVDENPLARRSHAVAVETEMTMTMLMSLNPVSRRRPRNAPWPNILPDRGVLAVVLLPLVLGSCVGVRWRQTGLEYNENGVAIWRESQFDEESRVLPQGNEHPVDDIPATQIGALLHGLTYEHERLIRSDETGPVFLAREVARIAGPLAEVLSKLGPDERARFMLCRTEKELFIFESRVCTSGVAFRKGGVFELAFDSIRDEPDDEAGDPRSLRFYTNPTAITNSSYRVIPPPKVHNHHNRETQQEYPLWVSASGTVLAELEQALAARIAAELGKTPGVQTDSTARPSPAVVTGPPPPSVPVVSSSPAGGPGVPRKLSMEVRGCSFYKYNGRIYGLPPGTGPLDPQKLRNNQYELIFPGTTIAEVRHGILEAARAGILK